MYGNLETLNTHDAETDFVTSAYTTLFLLAGVAAATYALTKIAQSSNRLNYDNYSARIIAGCLVLMMHMMHVKNGNLKELGNAKKTLIAAGPHRTGFLDGAAIAANMGGDTPSQPPQFLATDAFKRVPGVGRFLQMFKTIEVPAEKPKPMLVTASNEVALGASTEKSKVADEKLPTKSPVLAAASKVLAEDGCVLFFPQGGFSKIGEDPRRVYDGIAKLAVEDNLPIHVIRLDGFWCLDPKLPRWLTNNTAYRAFVTAFIPNNITTTYCCKITFHLQPENKHLSDAEKIKEICAQLYAFYYPTEDLTPKQIAAIKGIIADKTHHTIWEKKDPQAVLAKKIDTLRKEGTVEKAEIDELERQLLKLRKEGTELEEATLKSIKL